MNANSELAGLSYVEKLRTEARQDVDVQDPFAIYDALTPDEPIWAVQIAKHWLKIAIKRLVSPRREQPYARGLSIEQPLAD